MLRGQTGKLALTFTKEGVNLSRLRAARFREALLDSPVRTAHSRVPSVYSYHHRLESNTLATRSLEHVAVAGVLHGPGRRVRHRFKLRKVRRHVALEPNERAFVPHLVAVVWRAEHRDQLAVVVHLESLVLHLVRTDHQLQVVQFQKFLCHVGAKRDAHAAFARLPPGHRPRIAPQHLAELAAIGRLVEPVDLTQVVQGDAVPAEQTAVHHEDLRPEHDGEGQVLKHLLEEICEFHGVLRLDLTVEAVHLVHRRRLVVAANEVDAGRVHALVREQRHDHLGGVRPSVDEVSVEQIRVTRARVAVEVEDVAHVEELPVHVAAHGEVRPFRHRHVHQRGQRLQDRLGLHQNLKGVLERERLLVLEPRDHVLDEDLRDDLVVA